MRRFDKLKIIKEANLSLEKKFLSNKVVLSEQDVQGEVPNAPKKDEEKKDVQKKTSAQEDFELFKRQEGLTGNDKEAKGTIRGGNGKTIKINSNSTYEIFDVKNNSLQKGTYVSVGIGPAKHIELKPENGKNFLKVKNILSDLDKEKEKVPASSFYDNFKKFVRNERNLKSFTKGKIKDQDGIEYEFSYLFYHNKSNDPKYNSFYTVYLSPNSSDNGETGDFNILWQNSADEYGFLETAPGTFKNFGDTFITDKDNFVGAVDRSGKIDSGLISILSKVEPDYTNKG